MILLKILENELFDGYIGRLAQINGSLCERQLFDALAAQRQNLIASAFIAMLAEYNELSQGTLLERHSLFVPLLGGQRTRSFDSYDLNISSSKRVWDDYPKEGLWFCRACTVADVETRSFSYWRRNHQLPGIFSCPLHGVELTGVQITKPHPCRFSPADVLEETVITQSSINCFRHNLAVGRASNFISTRLDSSEILSSTLTNAETWRLAVTAALQSAGMKIGDLIRQIDQSFPPGWLRWQMPGGTFRVGGYFVYLSTTLHLESSAVPLLFRAMIDAVLPVKLPNVDVRDTDAHPK